MHSRRSSTLKSTLQRGGCVGLGGWGQGVAVRMSESGGQPYTGFHYRCTLVQNPGHRSQQQAMCVPVAVMPTQQRSRARAAAH